MSYILEALKKAQAERQIGETPTIHAPTLTPAADERRSAGARKPLLVGVGLLGGAVVVMGAMLLRQQSSSPAASAAASATPAVTASPNAAQPPSAPPAATAATVVPDAAAPLAPSSGLATPPGSAGVPQASAAAQSTGAAQTPAAGHPPAVAAQPREPVQPTEAPPRQSASQPSRVAAQPPASHRPSSTVAGTPAVAASEAAAARNAREASSASAGPRPSAASPHERAPDVPDARAASRTKGPRDEVGANAAGVATPVAEEHIQSLRELPEPIQRAIPQITLGGYMYSKNPSDRLILIDKTLRKEGDEVAPGLQLEKLLPKGAVFNFRGYRYKVPL